MGIVYLASKGSESVALKVVRESLIDHPSDVTRFAREIEALGAVDSPYVARILGSGVEGDQAWFATEFVNGPDLKSLISDKGPLDEERWHFLADGLLNGLEAIHAAGVIHRDIKPGNIIMSETGPKIIDFGIAQVSDATSVTSSGFVAGSPAWFSPEQIEGQVLTFATDLFSAGSVLVYAATGSSPWGDETTITKASVFKILTADPNLEGLSDKQSELVKKLMSKEPGERGIRNTASAPKKPEKTSAPNLETIPSSGPKNSIRSPQSWGRKQVILAVAGVVAFAVASIGVVNFFPASGRLSVYQHSTYTTSNPVLGDLILTIYRDSRLPIEVPLSGERSYRVADTRTKFQDVGEWDSNSEFRVALTSSYSDDPFMETEFFLSEAGISGLLQNPEIGIQIYVSDDEFEIVVLAPQLSGGTVEFKPIQSAQFQRGNEKEALAACNKSENRALDRKFSEAINIDDDWYAAYRDSGADYTGNLTFDAWASRYAKYKKGAQLLLDAVISNSPREFPLIDNELDRLISRAESKLDNIQAFIDYNYRHLYGGYSNNVWQELAAAADPYGDPYVSFDRSAISRTAKELCETRIQ